MKDFGKKYKQQEIKQSIAITMLSSSIKVTNQQHTQCVTLYYEHLNTHKGRQLMRHSRMIAWLYY